MARGLSAPVGITVDLSAPEQTGWVTSATDDVPGMTGTLDVTARSPRFSVRRLNGTGEAAAPPSAL